MKQFITFSVIFSLFCVSNARQAGNKTQSKDKNATLIFAHIVSWITLPLHKIFWIWKSNIIVNPNVLSILFHHMKIFRHGDRNTIDTYPNDPWRDESNWPEGFGQLTNVSYNFHSFKLVWKKKWVKIKTKTILDRNRTRIWAWKIFASTISNTTKECQLCKWFGICSK